MGINPLMSINANMHQTTMTPKLPLFSIREDKNTKELSFFIAGSKFKGVMNCEMK